MIGGINIPGGICTIRLRSNPSTSFHFLNDSRLKIDVTVGDIVILITNYNTDFHLALLPLKVSDSNFFEVLFNEKNLLENLTKSIFVDSEITDTTAIASLKYNDVLDVHYEWDVMTGILIKKKVGAPSGLQLLVELTDQVSIPGWDYPIFLVAIFILILTSNGRRKKMN
jgi:hypothetical protein